MQWAVVMILTSVISPASCLQHCMIIGMLQCNCMDMVCPSSQGVNPELFPYCREFPHYFPHSCASRLYSENMGMIYDSSPWYHTGWEAVYVPFRAGQTFVCVASTSLSIRMPGGAVLPSVFFYPVKVFSEYQVV
jgi:hypothetical protein